MGGGRSRKVHETLSGERRGLGASLARLSLLPLSWLFRLGSWGRSRLYDVGVLRQQHVEAPVLSIGNLTAGGTGKTPLAIHLAARALAAGKRVAVLSRGWGGEGGEAIRNEEGALLAQRVPDAVVLQGGDRVALARTAIRQHGCDLILLDDGFQHRRLARDFDLVVVDATCPLGYGHFLPRGLLREGPAALRRATGIVISRADQVEPDALAALRTTLERCAPGCAIVASRHRPVGLRGLDGRHGPPLSDLKGHEVVLVSAVGNPQAFERTVRALGAHVQGHEAWPDHYRYGEADVLRLSRLPSPAGVPWIVTTEKDAVKLFRWRSLLSPRFPLWALEIEFELLEEIPGLEGLLVGSRPSAARI
ncbi:MAG: tetraacyldisaccharide 4'-kinase [Planctomycetota bacterium]